MKNLLNAYDLLIETLHWERSRWLRLAVDLAARDQAKAQEILHHHAEYIREQATR